MESQPGGNSAPGQCPGSGGSGCSCTPPRPRGLLARLEDMAYKVLRALIFPALVAFRKHAGR